MRYIVATFLSRCRPNWLTNWSPFPLSSWTSLRSLANLNNVPNGFLPVPLYNTQVHGSPHRKGMMFSLQSNFSRERGTHSSEKSTCKTVSCTSRGSNLNPNKSESNNGSLRLPVGLYLGLQAVKKRRKVFPARGAGIFRKRIKPRGLKKSA